MSNRIGMYSCTCAEREHAQYAKIEMDERAVRLISGLAVYTIIATWECKESLANHDQIPLCR